MRVPTIPTATSRQLVFHGYPSGRVYVRGRDRDERELVPNGTFEWWRHPAEARDLAREILLHVFDRSFGLPAQVRHERTLAERIQRLGSRFVLYEDEVRRWIEVEQRAQ